jgi:hypothetical protein
MFFMPYVSTALLDSQSFSMVAAVLTGRFAIISLAKNNAVRSVIVSSPADAINLKHSMVASADSSV